MQEIGFKKGCGGLNRGTSPYRTCIWEPPPPPPLPGSFHPKPPYFIIPSGCHLNMNSRQIASVSFDNRDISKQCIHHTQALDEITTTRDLTELNRKYSQNVSADISLGAWYSCMWTKDYVRPALLRRQSIIFIIIKSSSIIIGVTDDIWKCSMVFQWDASYALCHTCKYTTTLKGQQEATR